MSNKPVITTYTGRHLNPLDIRLDDICLRDIAHALACVNRFGGHVSAPISVAQHSVFVSYYVERWNRVRDYPIIRDYGPLFSVPDGLSGRSEAERTLLLQALLHDASEAYLGDVTKWLKMDPSFAAYREAEALLQERIFYRFGVPTMQHPAVSLADKRVCALEAQFGGMKFASTGWPGYEDPTPNELSLFSDWRWVSWEQAEELFTEHFHDLGGRE